MNIHLQIRVYNILFGFLFAEFIKTFFLRTVIGRVTLNCLFMKGLKICQAWKYVQVEVQVQVEHHYNSETIQMYILLLLTFSSNVKLKATIL